MEPLLIEIGTEEIPSGYIEPALHAFRAQLTERLQKERIEHGSAVIYGTPRRLAVVVEDVASRQSNVTTEIIGPPEKVAYDGEGRPTTAAVKFAEKAGVSVNRLEVKDTEKGRYLCIQKTEKGQNVIGILKQALPEMILSIPFPKTMRWKNLRTSFARPIHTIAALYGNRVISFTVGDVKSGRFTFGHRFMSSGKIRLDHPGQYIEKLHSNFVIAGIEQRKALMKEKMAHAVANVGGRIHTDDELADMVCHLVEYPEVVLGAFNRKFLELPPEILVTAMRTHQRYFAVMDRDGKMMPNFVAVSNNRARDMKVVVAGYERVLAARLEDARFFYNADLKESLDRMLEKLKNVVYQARLGSVYDKTQRVRTLCGILADMAGLKTAEKSNLDTAALYCKADLVSHVVIEFPNLQGLIGRVYAQKAGYPEAVSAAIEAHYRPTHSGGKLPENIEGAVLGIADKLDTLCGCFLIGLVPTGASDPYALRRQAIGLIATARAFNLGFSLPDVIYQAMVLFGGHEEETIKGAADQLDAFLRNRMAHMLEEDAIPKDMAAAVLAVSSDRVPDVWNRALAFLKMKSAPGFDSLAVAFKRVVNIIRKADPEETGGDVRPSIFDHQSESMLYDAFILAEKKVADCLKKQDAETAFTVIAGIKGPVDKFFDDVMVMTDNPDIRRNRLALLRQISELFARLADFSKIST